MLVLSSVGGKGSKYTINCHKLNMVCINRSYKFNPSLCIFLWLDKLLVQNKFQAESPMNPRSLSLIAFKI